MLKSTWIIEAKDNRVWKWVDYQDWHCSSINWVFLSRSLNPIDGKEWFHLADGGRSQQADTCLLGGSETERRGQKVIPQNSTLQQRPVDLHNSTQPIPNQECAQHDFRLGLHLYKRAVKDSPRRNLWDTWYSCGCNMLASIFHLLLQSGVLRW